MSFTLTFHLKLTSKIEKPLFNNLYHYPKDTPHIIKHPIHNKCQRNALFYNQIYIFKEKDILQKQKYYFPQG